MAAGRKPSLLNPLGLGTCFLVASFVHSALALPSPPAPCGTLDLTSHLTQHCFPEDGKFLVLEINNFQPYSYIWFRFSFIIVLNSLEFNSAGSHHFVCCVDIKMPENPHSPHGNFNPLERVIKTASNSSSYSWCTCSEEICTQQLGGRVAWNQNGVGWQGYLPPRSGDRPLFNKATGLLWRFKDVLPVHTRPLLNPRSPISSKRLAEMWRGNRYRESS